MGIISSGKKTLQIEAEALREQCNRLDESFEKAVRIVLDGTGKLIVTGMGKSGIVGKKMAATFASTGTPSFFMHPGEAYHGDLGMIERHDVVLALSFSGETDEVLKLIPFIKSNGNKLISITGKIESTLAKNSDVHLALHVSQEACPLSLAPTTSTTATPVSLAALLKARVAISLSQGAPTIKQEGGARRILITTEPKILVSKILVEGLRRPSQERII
jgi:arabinose-5-phosphate isomerase